MSLASFISHFPQKTKQNKNFKDYVFGSVLNNKILNKVTGKIVDKPVDKATKRSKF